MKYTFQKFFKRLFTVSFFGNNDQNYYHEKPNNFEN